MMMIRSKEESAAPVSLRDEAVVSPGTGSQGHGDRLSQLATSWETRQALQPVVERLLMAPGGVFCVASAEAGEGRTLVATALALMMSEMRDVLLVDADARHPSIHDLFEVPRSPGFTDCLLAEHFLKHAVTSVGKLRVLPAGGEEVRPRLARTGAAKRLLEDMGRAYDFAFVDLPPLTAMDADAAALCDWADGTLMVVRAHATKASVVRNAMEMIDRQKVLGVVLNREQEDVPRWLRRLVAEKR